MFKTKALYTVHMERKRTENDIQGYQHIDRAGSQVLSSRMSIIADATLETANSRVKIDP